MKDTRTALLQILPEWHLTELKTMGLPDEAQINQYDYMKPDFFRALNRMKGKTGSVIDAVVSMAGVLIEKASGIAADLTSMPRVPAYGVRSPSGRKESGSVVLSKSLGAYNIEAISLVSEGQLSLQVRLLEQGRRINRPYGIKVFDINGNPVTEQRMVMPEDDPPVFREPEPGEYEFVLFWDNWKGRFNICFKDDSYKVSDDQKNYKWSAPDINPKLVYRAIEKQDPEAREELWVKIVQLVYWLATPGFCKRNGIDQEDVGDLIHRVLTEFTAEPVLPEMDPKKREEQKKAHKNRQRRLLENENLPGFFMTVLKRRAVDFYRKKMVREDHNGGSLNEPKRSNDGEMQVEKLDLVAGHEDYGVVVNNVFRFLADHFSADECKVFYNLIQGFSAKEVGEEFGLTPYKIYAIRDRIREKIKTSGITIPQRG